jgi:glycerophosphoryl diester phosphodiesterase
MNPWPYPRWIAHRGAGQRAPENTLAAFRVGASHGWRAFECDVKLSADGVPFLLHDTTLERTTSGRGIAAEHDWSVLSRLDAGGWHSAAFAGEPPASLESIASYVLANGFALNLELKPTPGQEGETGAAVAEAVARLWHGQALKPLLSSFKPNALAAAQAVDDTLPRALLLDSLHEGWLEEARLLGCVALVAKHSLIDDAVVARLREAGLHTLAYTVNDEIEATRLLALGLDGLITDAVDVFTP